MKDADEPMADPADLARRPAPVAAPRRTGLAETPEGLPWASSQELKRESNPFTDGDWRMLFYAWSGFLLRMVLIVGAGFSVVQYLSAREEKRVERTLELVDLWEQPDYQKAQSAIRRRLAGLNDKFANLLGANPSPTELAVFSERIGIEAMSADGGDMPLADFQESFDRIVYFLNRLSFCVEGNLCSREMADAYFRDYAVSFWSYFSGYIASERKSGSANFARPIEDYLRVGQPSSPAK